MVNAPIFWRVSSFEASLTNKKITFWIQIQKLARFSSLWVGLSFRHYHCKKHLIFYLGPTWFAFVTHETTSTKKEKHSSAEIFSSFIFIWELSGAGMVIYLRLMNLDNSVLEDAFIIFTIASYFGYKKLIRVPIECIL